MATEQAHTANEETPLIRLTRAIDPSTVPIQLRNAWTLRMPAPPGPGTMASLQKLLKVLQREHGADLMRHVKTIRKTEDMDAVLAYQADDGPLSSADGVQDLINKHEPSLLEPGTADGDQRQDRLRLVPIPTTPIPTRSRIAEWNAYWPCVLRMSAPVPVKKDAANMNGSSRGSPAVTSSSASIDFVDRAADARGWTQDAARLSWAREGLRHCVRAAAEARAAGELPIAAHVAAAFGDRDSNRQGLLPISAHDTRTSSNHPLRHAVLNAIRAIADRRSAQRAGPVQTVPDDAQAARGGLPTTTTITENGQDYLLNALTLFTTHEPCTFCSMALVHSRVRQVFFVLPSPGAGALCGHRPGGGPTQPVVCEGGDGGGPFALHEQAGLNHHFEVWRWVGGLEELGILREETESRPPPGPCVRLRDLQLTGINP